MKKIIFSIVILTVVLMACSKTENPATTYYPLDKYNLAGTYRITAKTFRPENSQIEYDVYNIDTILKTCEKDDLLTFDTNYVYSFADSGIRCSSHSFDTIGTYVISSPNNLVYKGQHFVVQSLSTSTLVLSQSKILSFLTGNIMGIEKTTYTKQP